MDKSSSYGRMWRLRVIGTVLSVALLVWLLTQQDWAQILESIRDLSAGLLLLTFGLVLTRYLWQTARWLILIRAQDIDLSYWRCLQLVFSGLFISNFLPTMVGGDVVRIAGVVQASEKKVAAAASVIVDRIIGVIGMLFVLPLSIPLIRSLMDTGFSATGQLTLVNFPLKDVLQDSYQRSKDALSLWINQPRQLILALIVSLMGTLSYLSSVWVLVQGLGIDVEVIDIAGISALTYFLTLIPLSINGFGLREVAFVGLYSHAGASTEQATALALLTRLFFLAASVIGVAWVGGVVNYVQSENIHPEDEL